MRNDEFRDVELDHVFAVCGHAHEFRPVFPPKTETHKQAESVHKRLHGESGVRLIDADRKTFSGGVIISTAHLAKGLEFNSIQEVAGCRTPR